MEELKQNLWIIVFWVSLVTLFVVCSWKYEEPEPEAEEDPDLRVGLPDRRHGAYVGHIAQYDRRHPRATRREVDRKMRRGTDL